ncbi:MAG: amidohydrolase [Mycoplasmoidaceae bacterium]
MKKKLLISTLLFPTIAISNMAMVSCSKKDGEKNTILLGNVETMDPNNPSAKAIVVKDGHIEFVGSKKEAYNKYKNKNTKVVDYGDDTIYPGFMDGHAHAHKIATQRTLEFQMLNSDSYEECIDKLQDWIDDNPDSTCYVGTGWQRQEIEGRIQDPDYHYFEDLGIGAKWVVLNSEDLHTVWVNKQVLDDLGIDKDFVDYYDPDHQMINVFPEGDPNAGEPTGVMQDDMHVLVNAIIPHSADEFRTAFHELEDYEFSQGFTAVNDGAMFNLDGSVFDMPEYAPLIETLGQMSLNNELKLRIYGNNYIIEFFPDFIQDLLVYQTLALANEYNSEHFKLIGTKVFIDGTVEGATALLTQPYTDDEDSYGTDRWEDNHDQLEHIVELSNTYGMPVHFHAIGDAASALAINTIESVQEKHPETKDMRNTILHLQLVTDETIQKMKDCNVIGAVAPLWTPMEPAYKQLEEEHLGLERQHACYPFQTLINKGIPCVYHTDNPVSTLLPHEEEVGCIQSSIYLASSRKLWWDESEELEYDSRRTNYEDEYVKDRRESIKAMTTNVAYEFGVEDELGSIEKGKVANFTIFDTDLINCDLDDILKAKLTATIVDGQKVWPKQA